MTFETGSRAFAGNHGPAAAGRGEGLVRGGQRCSPRRAWIGLLAVAVLATSGVAHAAVSPLADAAEAGDWPRLREMIEAPDDVNAPQPDDTTALHWVSRRDNLPMARLLLEAGADAGATNRYGVAPLTIACTNGNGALVELLLEAGADPDTTLPGGETALMTAARTGRVGPVRALLAHGADLGGRVHGMGRREGAGANAFNRRINDPTIFGFETRAEQTALIWAVAEGHAEVTQLLIEAGADFRSRLASGFTPLLLAARNGRLEAVKVLLEAGVDVNRPIDPEPEWRHTGYGAKLRPGATALHVAVENGHLELAAHLLEHGADPRAADPVGYTALHAIPGVRRIPPGDGNPPPEITGSLSSLEFVKLLIESGADPDASLTGPALINLGSAVLGPTALLAAVQTADVDLMEVLVEAGADPLLRDQRGGTALMLAGARAGSERDVAEAIEFLLDLGVNVNAVSEHGETAMHAAAYRDRAEPIRVLAARGANPELWNRGNRYGLTPLAIATGYRGPRSFRPQPKAEVAIREVMAAAGLPVPAKVVVSEFAGPKTY